MPTVIQGNTTSDKYVGYMNDVDLFIEAMYDEKRNPNGIGKLKLCVNSTSFYEALANEDTGIGTFYREIFGLNNYYENYNVSSSYRSSKNQVKVNYLKNITKTIKFIINDDIQFGGGNDWEDSLNKLINIEAGGKKLSEQILSKGGSGSGSLKELGGMLKNKGGVLKAALGGLAGNAVPLAMGAAGVQLKTLMQTVKFWQGSHEPGPFHFKFNMLATRPDMDIRRDLLALYATVYPVSITDAYGHAATMAKAKWNSGVAEIHKGSFFSGIQSIWNSIDNVISGGLSGFMSAPLGYNPVSGYISSLYPTTEDGSGLIDIRIGKWLHLPNLLVKGFDATISKVTTRFGFPLYATCNIQVQPVRMWTISDIYDSFYSTVTSDEYSIGIDEGNGKRTRNFNALDKGTITKVKVGEMP